MGCHEIEISNSKRMQYQPTDTHRSLRWAGIITFNRRLFLGYMIVFKFVSQGACLTALLNILWLICRYA